MLEGNIDQISVAGVSGWVRDTDETGNAVSVVVSANGSIVGRLLANRYRPDLAAAAIGEGRHGFEFAFVPPLPALARWTIAIRREEDGAHLPGSPKTIGAFDAETAAGIAQVLCAFDDEADLQRRLTFLAEQADKLWQLSSDRRRGGSETDLRRRITGRDPGARFGAATPVTETGRRALVIDERIPARDRDAGSNAILSHMRALQRLGYEVAFMASDLAPDGNGALSSDGILSYARPWYASVEEVLIRQARSFDLVYLHRASVASRYVALARHHQPKARLVYSVADLHFLRLMRQADIEQRPELGAQSEGMRLLEMSAARQADAVVTHSSFEAALLRRQLRPESVHVVPWAVPARPTEVPFGQRHGIAFIGNYAHPPNVDAARWLVEAIMPELERRDPEITCFLVGRDMPDILRRLARTNVVAIGGVEDLAEIFDRVRVTVAPLAFGAGVKGKVLDSLAAGIPCVCTPSAAEGIDLPDLLRSQIAETPQELARMLHALHTDEVLNRLCSRTALGFIARAAGDAQVDAALGAACGLPA